MLVSICCENFETKLLYVLFKMDVFIYVYQCVATSWWYEWISHHMCLTKNLNFHYNSKG